MFDIYLLVINLFSYFCPSWDSIFSVIPISHKILVTWLTHTVIAIQIKIGAIKCSIQWQSKCFWACMTRIINGMELPKPTITTRLTPYGTWWAFWPVRMKLTIAFTLWVVISISVISVMVFLALSFTLSRCYTWPFWVVYTYCRLIRLSVFFQRDPDSSGRMKKSGK